jgi:hypothetical protein
MPKKTVFELLHRYDWSGRAGAIFSIAWLSGRPAREQVVKLRGDPDANAYACTGMQYREATRVARSSPERHVKLLPRVGVVA